MAVCILFCMLHVSLSVTPLNQIQAKKRRCLPPAAHLQYCAKLLCTLLSDCSANFVMCPCVCHSCLIGMRPVMWRVENTMTNHYTPPISIPFCTYCAECVSPYCPCEHDPQLYTDCYDCTVKTGPLTFDLALARLVCNLTTLSSAGDLWGGVLISSPVRANTQKLSQKIILFLELRCIHFPPW